MFVLGLQGSPRKGGNTDTFLSALMNKTREAGAAIQTVQVARADIKPCRGCGYCEQHGTCIIADDAMALELYGLIRSADVIVAASPVFFYGITAQLKSLIDRCQTLWSRKYLYKLQDPLASTRKGILFSVAASKGRRLFDGIELTATYFFDAIDADFSQTIAYRGVEAKGAIANHTNFAADIDRTVDETIVPLIDRKRVLFVSKSGACRAPLAAALAQRRYGKRIRTEAAGLNPVQHMATSMIHKAEQEGIDLGFRSPQPIDQAMRGVVPDLTVAIGEGFDHHQVPGRRTLHWPIAGNESLEERTLEPLVREINEAVSALAKDVEEDH